MKPVTTHLKMPPRANSANGGKRISASPGDPWGGAFFVSRVLEPAYWAARDVTYSWHELKGNCRDLPVAGRRLRRLRRCCGVGTPSGISPSGIWTALRIQKKKNKVPYLGPHLREPQSPTPVIPGWGFFCVCRLRGRERD